MRVWFRRVGCVAAAVASLHCASSTRGGGEPQAASYKKNLGTAALPDVLRQVPRMFHRYQFEIERDDASPTLVSIQSRWSMRYPLQDEIARGVTEALTRLVVTARARGRRATVDVRVVALTAENMVLFGDSPRWHQGIMTPMFKAYIDQIADQLKTELQTGIRVY